MNFSEFKKLIGADPGNREPETLRARKSAPEFEAVAAEAEAFEEKLQAAVNCQLPSGLLEKIKDIGQQPTQSRNWVPLALAASVIIAVGAVGLAWKQAHQWDSVEEYVADHYPYDGPGLVEKATAVVDPQKIIKIMARLDASIGQQLTGRIKFIKFCPTPEGRGAHMVVSTDQGPMTIIFMPKTLVTDGEIVKFNQMQALMVSLEHGSAAIIGYQTQTVERLASLVRNTLKTRLVDA